VTKINQGSPGLFALSFVVTICLQVPASLAQETEPASQSEPSRFFALPLEIDTDSGAANGDATILRIAPLYGLGSIGALKVVHIDLVTIADAPGGVPGRPGNPNPEPGERVFGISDLVHASFFTLKTSGKASWGFGGMLSIPIASDDKLGSGKWSLGPSFRFTYKSGKWNLGAFGGQIWSFAGDDERNDVSQLIVRGAVRRQMSNSWYFVSSPIITANWNATGQKWLVPLGGGFGKVFRVKSNPWALSLQGYYNVVKPDGAPNWSARLSLIAPIPFRR
jgi:hypothetical protein